MIFSNASNKGVWIAVLTCWKQGSRCGFNNQKKNNRQCCICIFITKSTVRQTEILSVKHFISSVLVNYYALI